MKAAGRRVGSPIRVSTNEAQASVASNVIKALDGRHVPRSAPGIHSDPGIVGEALWNKRFNTVKRGERYERAVKAINTVNAMIANRVLTPPGRKT
jgi:hypothetical protein